MTPPFVADSGPPHSLITPQTLPVPPLHTTPRPFWSVIVPVYNRTLFLPECLNSILDQQIPPSDMEILLADNSDAVDLSDQIKSLGRNRITHLRMPDRKGLYPKLNAALHHTRGTWIHILHDDDFVLPNFYSTLRRAVEHLPPTVAIANCHYSNVRSDGTPPWSPPPFRDGPGILPNWIHQLIASNPLNFPAVIYRRELFKTIGTYREDLPYAGDWELYLRAATTFDWWYQPENLARFRLHQGNLSWLFAANAQAAVDIRRLYQIAETYLPAGAQGQPLATAKHHHAASFIAEAAQLLSRGNLPLAARFLREALLLSPDLAASPEIKQLLAAHPDLSKILA